MKNNKNKANDTLCDNVGTELQEICVQLIGYKEAVRTENITYCNELSTISSTYASACYREFIDTLQEKGAIDAEKCNGIDDERYKADCLLKISSQ